MRAAKEIQMKPTTQRCSLGKASLVMFLSMVPLLMGATSSTSGCQAFTDAFFTALESATGAAVDAAITNLFDNVRN